jgi:tartrate dehydratase beta subunit/fumarate hydratase class I family protein
VDESGREWIGHAKDFCEVQVEDLPITIAADVEGANIVSTFISKKYFNK